MKKLLLFCLSSFISVILIAQSCLPDGITFSSQDQINSFQANYPGCTEIEGDVVISGNNITNLNGLNVLTSIQGYVWIYENGALTGLNGLEGLTSIGEFLEISYNPALTSLAGMEGLTSVGGNIWVSDNASLVSMNGFEGLTSVNGNFRIAYNESLNNLTGLEGITSVAGDLEIIDNDALTNLTGLGAVTSVGGTLEISYHEALISLTGLEGLTTIGAHIWIYDNTSLTSLLSLEGVTSVGGTFWISNNDALTSLEGLDNIDANSIVDITVIDHMQLSNCDVQSICDYLADPNGEIFIENNAPGCNSVDEVEEACGTTDINTHLNVKNITCFPNPFTATVILSVKLQKPEKVSMSIYNNLGQLLINQEEENSTEGNYQLKWNAEEYSEGLYFYRIKVGNTITNGTIVKIK
jgi:hypothetical protein